LKSPSSRGLSAIAELLVFIYLALKYLKVKYFQTETVTKVLLGVYLKSAMMRKF